MSYRKTPLKFASGVFLLSLISQRYESVDPLLRCERIKYKKGPNQCVA